MNGMNYQTGYAYNFDSDYHTVSHHWELPPQSTIAELSLTQYFEMDDETSVELGIKRVEYLDSDGVTRHRDYKGALPTVVSFNRMTRVDWEITVRNCWGDYLLNVFFWDHVS